MSTILERRREKLGRAKVEAEMSLVDVFNSKNCERAEVRVIDAFRKFAAKIAPAEVNDFFDPRNRDTWTSAFARLLEGTIDPDFPSND